MNTTSSPCTKQIQTRAYFSNADAKTNTFSVILCQQSIHSSAVLECTRQRVKARSAPHSYYTQNTHVIRNPQQSERRDEKKTICFCTGLCSATLTGEQRLHNRILIETMLVLMFFHHAAGGLIRFSRTGTES